MRTDDHKQDELRAGVAAIRRAYIGQADEDSRPHLSELLGRLAIHLTSDELDQFAKAIANGAPYEAKF